MCHKKTSCGHKQELMRLMLWDHAAVSFVEPKPCMYSQIAEAEHIAALVIFLWVPSV